MYQKSWFLLHPDCLFNPPLKSGIIINFSFYLRTRSPLTRALKSCDVTVAAQWDHNTYFRVFVRKKKRSFDRVPTTTKRTASQCISLSLSLSSEEEVGGVVVRQRLNRPVWEGVGIWFFGIFSPPFRKEPLFLLLLLLLFFKVLLTGDLTWQIARPLSGGVSFLYNSFFSRLVWCGEGGGCNDIWASTHSRYIIVVYLQCCGKVSVKQLEVYCSGRWFFFCIGVYNGGPLYY